MNQMLSSWGKLWSRPNQYLPAEPELQEANANILPDLWASSSSGFEYEVFLSFRGPDTRTGFGDFLYCGLTDAGVRVFRDSEGLRRGNCISSDLQKAIKQSKISIPILSLNYASSRWCLMELSLMMELRRSGNQMVLPIFYDVPPSDVRHHTGTYGVYLNQHRWDPRLHSGQLQKWRDACAEVGGLAGWVSEDVENGYEGKLVKLVVKKVLSELKKAHLRVVDTLVGLEDDADAILRLLNVGMHDVKIVGISGMGGIGKTTLAKVIYNKVLDHFDCHAFLEDIREASSQKNGLKHLQSILLSSITRQERQDFASLDEGSNELSDRCRDKKVLILLDDVDDTSQINALVGGVDWFGPGSRIIVTTRNIDILSANQEVLTYEVKPLSQDRALQLFCKNAFKCDLPTKGLSDLCRDIVRTTGGLPLALEVIGAFLCDKREAVWEDTLAKLKKIPDEKVQDRLKISYEALNHQQKQIFLDIACFFIGMDARTATCFWQDCQFFPRVGLEILLRKSLIKIGDDNKLWMHDQLRDLGREIIREENYKEPGRRSRLWDSEEAFTVLDKLEHPRGTSFLYGQGATDIEAISLIGREGCAFSDISFAHLSNVRFLQLGNAKLVGDFQHLPPNLRWLSWRKSPFSKRLTDLELEDLVILDLSHSDVTEDWDGWNSYQIGTKLKVLDLSYCHKLISTPDFSKLQHLERLILEGCKRLVMVDPSILNLKRLAFLNVKHCVNLMELPQGDNFAFRRLTELLVDGTCIRDIPVSPSMKELEIVTAKGCARLTQIRNVGRFTLLSRLILDSSGIRALPHSIGSLVELQKLSLNNCYFLSELPETVGQLTSLVELSLSGTKVAALPISIGELVSLKVLEVNCSNIKFLPAAVGKLTKLEVLNASGCRHLEGEIPAEIGRLSNLKLLTLDCTKIVCIPVNISELSHLQSLHLNECDQLQPLPSLPVGLTSVRVTCKSLTPIPNVSDLVHLKNLGYVNCPNLVELPQDISKLSKLEKLELSATDIRTLPDRIGDLPQLRILDINNCPNLQTLPALPPSLTRLIVKHGSLLKLPDLVKLRSLSELHLVKCATLAEIPTLENLVSLNCLVLTCSWINKLDGLGSLHWLTYLDVSGNANLEQLPNLSKLKRLSVIKARGCEKLVEIQGLENLHVLKHLDITNCTSIENLPDLSSLKLLSSFSANGCKNMKELRGVDELESLSSLQLSGCAKLKCLPDLSKLRKLRQLNVAGCDNMGGTELQSDLKSLERLTVSEISMLFSQANMKFRPRGTASNFGNIVAACNDLETRTKGLQLDSVNQQSFLSRMFSRECNSNLPHCKTAGHLTVTKLGGDLTAIYPSNDTASVQDRVVFVQRRLFPSSSKDLTDA